MFGRLNGNDLIVFIIMHFKPRYVKMAKALKNRNFRLVFLMEDTEFNRINRFEIPAGIHICYFKSPEGAMRICKKYRPLVFHIFVEKNYETAYFLIKHKKQLGKVIYSEYDLFWGYYKNASKKSAERAVAKERYCFENADGICFRDWGGEFLEKNTDYDIRGKWVMLLDGCSGVQILKRSLRGLHLCFAGGVNAGNVSGIYSHNNELLPLIDRCEKERVHLHIYPTRKDHILYASYIAMSNSMKYFHFYDPLPYSELINRISQYDYGIDISLKPYEETTCTYTKAAYRYDSGNKYFDYLEAELPVIAPCAELLADEFEKKGVCIRENIMTVDFKFLAEKKGSFEEAVRKAKADYNMERNIQKLIELYEKVNR